MQSYKSIIIYGFAIFIMFFGSGNLVFPLQIGYNTGDGWLLGFVGLLCTGIFLPFLGLFVIKLHKGSYISFFSEAGDYAKVFLPLLSLSLLGSFGVVPRCITVAYGGMHYVMEDMSLAAFSFIFCLVTYLLCLKDQIMISILGKWMSPILLISLVFLIVVGVTDSSEDVLTGTNKNNFLEGFTIGYQTMDLLAAFFFSSLIFIQIQDKLSKANHNSNDILKFAIKPSIFAMVILALVYLGFVFLGSHYSNILHQVEPEYLLPTIAQHLMGNKATIIIGVTMIFSCITTAIALNNIYARYLCHLLKLKDNKFPLILLFTTLTSFIISLLNFKGIASFLGPILVVSYPGIIMLTILSIFTQRLKQLKIILFYGMSFLMIIKMFIW